MKPIQQRGDQHFLLSHSMKISWECGDAWWFWMNNSTYSGRVVSFSCIDNGLFKGLFKGFQEENNQSGLNLCRTRKPNLTAAKRSHCGHDKSTHCSQKPPQGSNKVAYYVSAESNTLHISSCGISFMTASRQVSYEGICSLCPSPFSFNHKRKLHWGGINPVQCTIHFQAHSKFSMSSRQVWLPLCLVALAHSNPTIVCEPLEYPLSSYHWVQHRELM